MTMLYTGRITMAMGMSSLSMSYTGELTLWYKHTSAHVTEIRSNTIFEGKMYAVVMATVRVMMAVQA